MFSHLLIAQSLIRPPLPGDSVTLLPTDLETLEADLPRKDLPCTVSPRKTELGFDLRFHGGYDVTVPLHELSGGDDLLTILFRVYRDENRDHPYYFTQHIRVPAIEDDARGEALLQGALDLGEGKFHVDWLMRDRAERLCSSKWDTAATLSQKDRPMSLFIKPGDIAESIPEPFSDQPHFRRDGTTDDSSINVKLLVNFAPQHAESAELQRSDTDALVSILRAIEFDPHIAHISLIAFNIQEHKIVYRQDAAEDIDFHSLGQALQTMKLGTVDLARLSQKHGDTDFLQTLIEQEIGNSARPDAVIFAGPKAMLNADVPQDDLRRIGDLDCPVFYMNYNLNPQAVPWKDSISHAIHAFKGVEYTISRPRDLWFSTTEMVNRIVRAKRQRVLATAVPAGGSR